MDKKSIANNRISIIDHQKAQFHQRNWNLHICDNSQVQWFHLETIYSYTYIWSL